MFQNLSAQHPRYVRTEVALRQNDEVIIFVLCTFFLFTVNNVNE